MPLTSSPAIGRVQDKAQQGCINQLNKGGAKVAAAQGKEGAGCMKDAGKGKLVSAEACLTADAKNKVGKAKQKNIDGETKKYTTAPDFGTTSAAKGNTVASDEDKEPAP